MSTESTTPQNLILVSDRDEDQKFFGKFAQSDSKIELSLALDWESLLKELAEHPNAIVVWDADHPGIGDPSNPRALPSILQVLKDHPHSFAISTEPLYQYYGKCPDLLEILTKARMGSKLTYQSNLLRRYDQAASYLYPRLFRALGIKKLHGLAPYFNSDVRIQKISLKRSEERFAAVSAIESFLNKSTIEGRLASKIAQCCDELIMNAIFSAPRDHLGNAYRQMLNRKSKFEFVKREMVDIEIGTGEDYFGVCVTDLFGSLESEKAVRFLGQDYQTQDYTPRKYGPGAGLGLYGIVQSGMSLCMRVMPNQRTDAILFFKKTRSVKDFRTSFQFCALQFLHA